MEFISLNAPLVFSFKTAIFLSYQAKTYSILWNILLEVILQSWST